MYWLHKFQMIRDGFTGFLDNPEEAILYLLKTVLTTRANKYLPSLAYVFENISFKFKLNKKKLNFAINSFNKEMYLSLLTILLLSLQSRANFHYDKCCFFNLNTCA